MLVRCCFFLGLVLIVNHSTYGKNKIYQDISTIEETLYFYPAKGEKLLNELIADTEKEALEEYEGQLNFLSGVLAYKKGESDSALVHLEKALIAFVNDEDNLYQAKAQLILGWLAEKIGYWQQSKINYYKALDLVNKDNKMEQGMAYLGLARCKYYLREKNNNELLIGTNLLNAIDKKECRLYAEFINLVINRNTSETPAKLLSVANEYLKMGIHSNAANAYKMLASYYRKNRDMSSAHKYLDMALALRTSDYPSATLLPSLYQMKGLTYIQQKDYSSAESHLNKSLELSNKYNKSISKYYVYKALFRIDTIRGDYKSGLVNFSKAVANKKAHELTAEKQLAKLMEISLHLKTLQEEIKHLQSLKNRILVLSLMLILIVLAFSMIVYYKRELKNRQKLEQERDTKQAFHSLLVNLAEKRLLNQGEKVVKKDIKNLSDEVVNRESSLFNDFEECYSESIKKIQATYPELTYVDAIYGTMFSLNLSNTVIAEIKNINPDTIRKTKLRMRNKLNLDKGSDLGEFFTCTISSQ